MIFEFYWSAVAVGFVLGAAIAVVYFRWERRRKFDKFVEAMEGDYLRPSASIARYKSARESAQAAQAALTSKPVGIGTIKRKGSKHEH